MYYIAVMEYHYILQNLASSFHHPDGEQSLAMTQTTNTDLGFGKMCAWERQEAGFYQTRPLVH